MHAPTPDRTVDEALRTEADLPTLAAWIACVVLLAGWGVYLASTLGAVRYDTNADEAWYLRYATEVSTRGLSVFPELFARYLGDPTAQIYPNPLRVLYIVASAGWCELFGASFASLSSLSLVCHLLAAVLTFAAARKHFGNARALVLACALGVSPLLAGLARRALMDSFATLTLVVATWCFLAWARDFASKRRAWTFALALWAVLVTKENHVLFVPAFGACVLWLAFGRGVRVPWLLAAAVFATPVALAAGVFVWAAGGIEPVRALATVIVASPATNDYAIRFGSGPWYRYVIDFLALSPYATLAGLAGAGALIVGRLERGRDALECCLAFAIVGLAEFALFTKNVRYLAGLDLAWRALATAFAFELAARIGARIESRARGPVALSAGLLLGSAACAFSIVTFRTFFLLGGLYDPISASLLGLRRIVPFALRE